MLSLLFSQVCIHVLTTGQLSSYFCPQPLYCTGPDFTPIFYLVPQLCP